MFRKKWEWAQWSGPQSLQAKLMSHAAVILSVGVFIALYFGLKLGAEHIATWLNSLI